MGEDKQNKKHSFHFLPNLLGNILPWGATAVAVAAVVDPACWRQAVHAEDVDDGVGGGPVKRSGVLAGVLGHVG